MRPEFCQHRWGSLRFGCQQQQFVFGNAPINLGLHGTPGCFREGGGFFGLRLNEQQLFRRHDPLRGHRPEDRPSHVAAANQRQRGSFHVFFKRLHKRSQPSSFRPRFQWKNSGV